MGEMPGRWSPGVDEGISMVSRVRYRLTPRILPGGGNEFPSVPTT